MIFKLYAIKDELSEYAPTLMPFEEDAQAKRWFRNYCEENPMVKRNPEDYSIWYVGEFDSKTGETNNSLPFPELVERAKGESANGN